MQRRDFLRSSAMVTALAACGESVTPPRQRTNYLALGDSVTEQRTDVVPYPVDLHDDLTPDGLSVLHNAGVSGCTTRQILDQWSDRVTTPCPAPDLVTIMFGINDHWIDDGTTSPRVPVDEFRANMHTICAKLNALPSRPLVVVLSATYIERDSLSRLQEYNAIAASVAQVRGLPVVNCFSPMAQLAGPDWRGRWTMNGDGVHPNSEAQRILAASIFPSLYRAVNAH
jgi:lysophospholipase L1-like esterase